MSRQIDISKNYITIQGFMVEKLCLTGNELILYALIYGFSQATDTEFTGTISYIMKWLGCSKPTVIKLLKKLCDDKLIIKHENYNNGVKFCTYICNLEKIEQETQNSLNLTSGKETLPPVKDEEENNDEQGVKKFNHQSKSLTDSKEVLPQNVENSDKGVVKKFNHRLNSLNGRLNNLTGGGKETLPNNILDNINNNILFDDEDIAYAREKIKEQIEYSHYEKNFSADLPYVDTIVEIMLEVYLVDFEKHFEIYGVNTKLFQERISKVDSSHIDYILEKIKTAHNIGNIKAYFAKMLFNAPSTIDTYYTREVEKMLQGAAN